MELIKKEVGQEIARRRFDFRGDRVFFRRFLQIKFA
jgi:hypothetical protein